MINFQKRLKDINPYNYQKAVVDIIILVEDMYEDIECTAADQDFYNNSCKIQTKIYETLNVLHKIVAQNNGLINTMSINRMITSLNSSDKILELIKFYELNKGSKNSFNKLRKSYLKQSRVIL